MISPGAPICCSVTHSSILINVDIWAADAISFWASRFPDWDRKCPVWLDFGPTCSWQALGACDACTDWGCGGWILVKGSLFVFCHEWSPAERKLAFVATRESTGVLETLGAFHWFSMFASFCSGLRTELWLDHKSAVQALARWWSPTPAMRSVLQDIRLLCVDNFLILHPCHVLGFRFNSIADHLSHNRVAQAVCLAKVQFGADATIV